MYYWQDGEAAGQVLARPVQPRVHREHVCAAARDCIDGRLAGSLPEVRAFHPTAAQEHHPTHVCKRHTTCSLTGSPTDMIFK